MEGEWQAQPGQCWTLDTSHATSLTDPGIFICQKSFAPNSGWPLWLWSEISGIIMLAPNSQNSVAIKIGANPGFPIPLRQIERLGLRFCLIFPLTDTPQTMTDTCQQALFNINEFIDELVAKYRVTSPGIYHVTHVSSPNNKKFGAFVDCKLWDPLEFLNENIDKFPKSRVLHPPMSPILSRPFHAISEADALFYFCNAVVIPTLHIVESFFPHVEIKVEGEKEETAKIQKEDEEEDVGRV